MSLTLEFQKWASAPPSWISSEGNDLDGTVLSSRLRLARNLSGFPFPHFATPKLQKQVLTTILSTMTTQNIIPQSIAFNLATLSSLEREFLMERHLISPDHARNPGEKGLVVSSGESLSVMVNEEDHIRAAAFLPGLSLDEAWDKLNQVDDRLGANLPLDYDEEFGYTTACPTNIGTAIRVSALLHLPALSMMGKIPPLIPRLNTSGLVVRGFFGEGTQALGDIFQLSNAYTLGTTEIALIKLVEKAVRNITDLELTEERQLRGSFRRLELEDRVYRAWGTLKMAKLLKLEEAMKFLSLLRLGVKIGMDIPFNLAAVTNLLFTIQAAHLILIKGERKDGPVDELRALFLQEKLAAH